MCDVAEGQAVKGISLRVADICSTLWTIENLGYNYDEQVTLALAAAWTCMIKYIDSRNLRYQASNATMGGNFEMSELNQAVIGRNMIYVAGLRQPTIT